MLAPWKKSYDKPRQCIKKQRHCFADKDPYSQSYGFPVVMSRCENWTIKKTECQRTDVFQLWCWRRLLRVCWTARRSNPSILKAISSEYSLEGLIPKLKLQYFGYLMWRTDSLEKTLMLGKIEGRKRRGRQRVRWLDGRRRAWVSSRSWWWAGKPGMLQSMWSPQKSKTTEGYSSGPIFPQSFWAHVWKPSSLRSVPYWNSLARRLSSHP